VRDLFNQSRAAAQQLKTKNLTPKTGAKRPNPLTPYGKYLIMVNESRIGARNQASLSLRTDYSSLFNGNKEKGMARRGKK
jgi:hypothetical protein